MTSIFTATVACERYAAGMGVLAPLCDTGADVGYTRSEVAGTREAFEAAISLVEAQRSIAKGSDKASLTHLAQRLRAAIA
jgi:hypothetical protein